MGSEIEDDRDALWTLLGKVRPPAVDPHFASRVLRSLPSRQARRSTLRQWLADFFATTLASPGRLAAGAAATLLAGSVAVWMARDPAGLSRSGDVGGSPESPADQALVDEVTAEFAMFDEVDSLLEVTDPSELEEDDVGRFLF